MFKLNLSVEITNDNSHDTTKQQLTTKVRVGHVHRAGDLGRLGIPSASGFGRLLRGQGAAVRRLV